MIRHDKKPATVCSRALSMALHPILMPLYATVWLAFRPPMTLLGATAKAYIAGTVALDGVALPALYIGLMMRLGLISDTSLSVPRQRLRPMIVLAACYGLCLWVLRDAAAAFLIYKVLLSALVCVVAATVLTPFWKISLHLIGMGAATAFISLLCISGAAGPWLLCTAVTVSGALASARLYLGAHNPAQTAAGFLTGAALTACITLFF